MTGKAKDVGEAEVQKSKDEQESQGFQGVEVDQTPNEHYTVPGQLAGKATPETGGAA